LRYLLFDADVHDDDPVLLPRRWAADAGRQATARPGLAYVSVALDADGSRINRLSGRGEATLSDVGLSLLLLRLRVSRGTASDR